MMANFDRKPQAKPQTIAERRASSNAQLQQQAARSASFGQADSGQADEFNGPVSLLPNHVYSQYDHQPYSASSSPVDGTGSSNGHGNMIPAPWGFMLPNSTDGNSMPNPLGDVGRNVSGYHTHDGSEHEASGSGVDHKGSAAANSKGGRAGNKRRQKFTRTRTGCLCCRSRRIKCDEGRPTCKRCIIAKRVVSHILPAVKAGHEY